MTYRQLLTSNPDFRHLWTGQVVSEIGDWLNNIAVLALAIQLAGPGRVGLAIAIYAIARHLPLFLFGPFAGVLADRKDRRRVMIAADLLRAFLALGFLLALRFQSLSIIYAVGGFLFSISAFFNAAKRATIPNLVSNTDELLAANSLSASTTAATIAVGSALGGAVATILGRDAVFVLNALTFVLSAEMIRRIKRPTSRNARQHSPEASSVRVNSIKEIAGRTAADFRAGLSYVARHPTLAAVFAVAAAWGLGNGAARALYSIFGAQLGAQTVSQWSLSSRELIERPTDFGISVLFVAMGLGGVLGAPLAKRFNAGAGDRLGNRMGRSLALDGVGLFLFSLMPTLWIAAAVLVAREMNFAIWWTAQQTIIMRETNDEFAGRVFASYETLTTMMMVGSMLASGAAADQLGIRSVAAAGGIVITLAGILWFVVRTRQKHEELTKDECRMRNVE